MAMQPRFYWTKVWVEAAPTAEDHLLARVREMGHGSIDHSEFIVGIGMKDLSKLFDEAVEVGLAHQGPAAA